jgi:hypothetical protein
MICPKCKEAEADKIYGLCEDCWQDYTDDTWFDALDGKLILVDEWLRSRQ